LGDILTSIVRMPSGNTFLGCVLLVAMTDVTKLIRTFRDYVNVLKPRLLSGDISSYFDVESVDP
jgi:hypothetical protein